MKKRDIIAIVYDFDGTLSPLPMQEFTVLPKIERKPARFWEEVKKENKSNKGEEVITYMMLMLKKANDKRVKITRKDLGHLAIKIKFFKGVKKFFKRMTDFAERESDGKVKLRHYIISSGLNEILQKIPIKKYFHNIFASEYTYDHYGAAQYPKLVVTDTVKTQFLFRINKGREDITENINQYMPPRQRPIPFSNIIYIGDGLTDVPCMSVATKQGGYAIAVYDLKKRKKGLPTCKELFKAGRVDFIAPADYSQGSKLDGYVKITLKTIIQSIQFTQTQQNMVKYYSRGRRK
jgi:hypothetical protein